MLLHTIMRDLLLTYLLPPPPTRALNLREACAELVRFRRGARLACTCKEYHAQLTPTLRALRERAVRLHATVRLVRCMGIRSFFTRHPASNEPVQFVYVRVLPLRVIVTETLHIVCGRWDRTRTVIHTPGLRIYQVLRRGAPNDGSVGLFPGADENQVTWKEACADLMEVMHFLRFRTQIFAACRLPAAYASLNQRRYMPMNTLHIRTRGNALRLLGVYVAMMGRPLQTIVRVDLATGETTTRDVFA